MTTAEEMLTSSQGFVKGTAYEALKLRALSACVEDDECDSETLSVIFADRSRLVFWGAEQVYAA